MVVGFIVDIELKWGGDDVYGGLGVGAGGEGDGLRCGVEVGGV